MVSDLIERFKIFYLVVKNTEAYAKLSFRAFLQNVFTCNCGSTVFILWSRYKRKLLPKVKELHIQRLRCSTCKKTHAVLPTFVFGQVHHDRETIEPYFQLFTQKQNSIKGFLAQSYNLPEAPEDDSTLYIWFKRFILRCKTLLPLLKNELMQLAPQIMP